MGPLSENLLISTQLLAQTPQPLPMPVRLGWQMFFHCCPHEPEALLSHSAKKVNPLTAASFFCSLLGHSPVWVDLVSKAATIDLHLSSRGGWRMSFGFHLGEVGPITWEIYRGIEIEKKKVFIRHWMTETWQLSITFSVTNQEIKSYVHEETWQ